MELNRELLYEYYDFLKSIDDKVREIIEGADEEITKTSFKVTESIVIMLFHLNPSLLKLKSRKKDVVEPRMLSCFILYLYLETPVQKICDNYNISRATLIHYCEVIVDEYLIYDEMKEKMDNLMTKTVMARCIRKLRNRKRT